MLTEARDAVRRALAVPAQPGWADEEPASAGAAELLAIEDACFSLRGVAALPLRRARRGPARGAATGAADPQPPLPRGG